MMKTLFIGMAAATMLVAPAFGQAMAPADYVKAAGAGDLYEITSSRTVLESTADPKVRSFATMMIRHHTRSTADVTAAAAKAKLPPMTPMLTPAQAEMVAQLKAESGPARDQAYIAQQKQAHGQALDLHMAYSEGGTSAPLKMAAAKIVPVVKSHVDMLRTM